MVNITMRGRFKFMLALVAFVKACSNNLISQITPSSYDSTCRHNFAALQLFQLNEIRRMFNLFT